jgi:two-component system chemotaxis response regulator CheB
LPVSIAAWFAYRCPLNVRDANDGESIPDIPGTVIVAPPNRDLMIHRGRVVLRHASADNGRVPCVDELFTSAAESHGESVIGVLLTGMGADGAAGLKRIRDGGGHTIAQDEDSCVVFGMPAAAIKLGGAERVIPLREIPHALIRLAGPSRQACESIGSYS